MNPPAPECLVFDSEQLIPPAWQDLAAAGPVRTFNPALLRMGDGWLLAYRVVLADGRRRIALCRLDASLRVIPGSTLPLSDQVRFAADGRYPEVARYWHADPRLYRWEDRLFVYWNSGWHEPQNHQFLQELDAVTLTPTGAPRELLLRGERRPLEKNWTFFADRTGSLVGVYSIAPQRMLRFSVEGTGDITFEESALVTWSPNSYPPSHGGLRGGAPPVWFDGCHWSFCHSVHDGPHGYCYAVGVYAFLDAPWFEPVYEPARCLELAPDLSGRRDHPRLNPAVDRVIYPCGAAHDGTRWLISHGINDEKCALSLVDHEAVLATVQPWPYAPPRAS